MAIHPTAIISDDAVIGKDVEIGPYAIIESNTVIGDEAFIDAHVKVCKYTTIGKKARLYMGTVVGEEPQDHRMVPNIKSFTFIGDGAILREYVTIHRSPFENATTKIGDGTLLMAFCHVGHDAQLGNHITCANHTALSGHVVVEDYAVISGYNLAHQFVRIGSLAMVSPTIKIRQDIPPYVLMSDLGYICGINVIGLRRANLTVEERTAIKKVVKLFCFKGLSVANALKEFENCDFKNKYTEHFANFYATTERGIMPADPSMVAIGSHKNDEGK